MATLNQLRDAMHSQPFVPFAVGFTDGRTYTVRHPDFVAIPASVRGREMTVYVESREDEEPEMHRIDVALITEIVSPCSDPTGRHTRVARRGQRRLNRVGRRLKRAAPQVGRSAGKDEPGMPVLEAHDVSKIYREARHEVPALRGVSLSVDRGEIVAIEGPSGSGKTTLLCILGCLLTPTNGRVIVDGHVVDSHRPEELRDLRRRSIGFVFQQFNLFAALTAAENVAYGLNLKGWSGKKARREADRVLDAVGLGERKDFRPRDLSGGQRQRVAVARALAGPASVILADEPTGNLDSESGDRVLGLFRSLARSEGRALVIVTHDARVRTIADRWVTIRDGRLTHEEN